MHEAIMYILYLPEAELIFGVIVLLFYEVMERHIVRYHDLNNAIRRLFILFISIYRIGRVFYIYQSFNHCNCKLVKEKSEEKKNVYLFIYLIYLFIYLSIYLYIYLSIYFNLSIYLSKMERMDDFFTRFSDTLFWEGYEVWKKRVKLVKCFWKTIAPDDMKINHKRTKSRVKRPNCKNPFHYCKKIS